MTLCPSDLHLFSYLHLSMVFGKIENKICFSWVVQELRWHVNHDRIMKIFFADFAFVRPPEDQIRNEIRNFSTSFFVRRIDSKLDLFFFHFLPFFIAYFCPLYLFIRFLPIVFSGRFRSSSFVVIMLLSCSVILKRIPMTNLLSGKWPRITVAI